MARSSISDIETFLVKYMDLIDNNQFENLYEQARIEFPTTGNINVIPLLNSYFYQAGIDPLEYLKVIPAFFIQYREEITSVNIPNHIVAIKDAAFRGSSIKEFTFPENLTSLGNYVFCYNKNLTNVILPKKCSALGSYVFADCENLIQVKYPGTREQFLKSIYVKRKRWLTRSSIEEIVCNNGNIKVIRKEGNFEYANI